MQRHKGLSILVPILLLISVWNIPVLAQSTSTPSPQNGDIVIVVVDVFEEKAGPGPVPVEKLDQQNPDGTKPQCAIAPDGQDGAAVRGNSVVTSSLHPYAVSHGRLVFMHFQKLLDDLLNNGVSSLTTKDSMLESWPIQNHRIWLQGVDTQKYNIDLIAVDVATAITDFKNQGVDRFVINMSFALVPCKAIPQVTLQDYRKQLSDWGVTCPNTGVVTGFSKLACEADKSTESNYDQNLINVRDSGIPEDASAYAILQLAVMRPLVNQALNSTILEKPSNEESDFTTFTNLLPPDIFVHQVASAGNDGKDYPFYPALNKNVLAVSADYTRGICPPGNKVDVANFLMTGLNISDRTTAEKIAKDLTEPKSNAGEVIEDGTTTIGPQDYFVNSPPDANVLGCVFGTSFAAPRLSIQMAVHLLKVDPTCFDQNRVAMPEPPLSHVNKTPPIWDSLEVPAAATLYCRDFPQ